MSEEVILRKSAFGGFRRADVLELIEKLQRENVELKKAASSLEEGRAELEEAKEKLAGLEGQKAELEARLEKLSADLKAEKQVSADDRASEIIRDAAKYADSIVASAKEDAACVLRSARARIEEAAQGVLSAQSRASTARTNLEYAMESVNGSVEQMLANLDAMGKELSGE